MTFQIRIFAFGPHQDNHRKDLRVVYVRYLYLDQPIGQGVQVGHGAQVGQGVQVGKGFQGDQGGRVDQGDQVGQGYLCPQGLREARDFSETIGNHQG